MNDLLLDPADAGAPRYTERPMPSWKAVAVAFLFLAAIYAPTAAADSPAGAALATGAAAVFLVVLFGVGMLEKHRVCERALLLGPTWPGAVPYVVPLVSIDPASVRLHYRANFMGRRLGRQGTPNLRMGVFSTIAISFTALHPLAAHPRRRHRIGSLYTEPLMRYGNAPSPPVIKELWVLATRRPDRLLQALEAALVDAGVPGARGLAERELRAPLVERWRRESG
ncbi:hypothetical protein [Sinosporangium siamense]|uniref:Uncharacterized protein n=1 Tax=Sinosporangium siamense TaxID=1367973 RepID=A0A919RS23_9ACTN|nr:hypothetical protein [Sinosporangium siamense]GII97496.1 hypothetical protein Ssi02_77270 [Sinosporangium siamense]